MIMIVCLKEEEKVCHEGRFTRVLSPKYDLDAYMATLFRGEAWDLCWELGRAKKLDPNLNTTPANIFA